MPVTYLILTLCVGTCQHTKDVELFFDGPLLACIHSGQAAAAQWLSGQQGVTLREWRCAWGRRA